MIKKIDFSVDYKFKIHHKPKIVKSKSIQNIKQRSGSVDYSTDNEPKEFDNLRQKRWFESDSIASINLASSLKLFHEDERSIPRVSSRSKMFGRKPSTFKLNQFSRRNTVG